MEKRRDQRRGEEEGGEGRRRRRRGEEEKSGGRELGGEEGGRRDEERILTVPHFCRVDLPYDTGGISGKTDIGWTMRAGPQMGFHAEGSLIGVGSFKTGF